MVYVHHTFTETANVESENMFRSRTIAILINYTMNKSLDRVSCADFILDPSFPYHEPTTTNNCNPNFGRRFGILIYHNNKATFHARTVSKCELMHFYSINIKPVALRTTARHSRAILNNLLSSGFPWRMG